MMKVKLLLIFCIGLSLLSCSGKQSINKDSFWDLSKYSVQRGDTLYSIAWRYDLDFKTLARWNKIASPYLIVPGQRLIMTAPVVEPKGKEYLFGSVNSDAVSPPSKNKVFIDYSQSKNIPKAPPISSSRSSRTKTNTSVPKYIHKRPVVAKVRPIQTTYKKPLTKGAIKWSWPISGKVITKFAANINDRKGIDIKGKQDQKVRSASSGIVVYSGAGLISYGNLVIIKHSDRFLSAYAFNKKLLVKEGARVKSGQSIAIIGKKLNVTNLLHFEIRKDGKPVNPLVYLP